ncbi:hypothetical protein [Aquimarina sp. 2201CG14-23]|uniref:hypothetical protein n=1 Tax=Aquimarina mycalae TaxID=3040073 RepID=UPI002477D61E|nr:hypothetical protein [Aquimarina sp. 2201CG14-23]MDH7444412.1 hypothetical protein [Aquimarina sp. 2201CG14-23]
MKSKSDDLLVQKYDLALGAYYFYDRYFIAEIKEGEVITLEKLQDLIPIVQKHFGNGEPFSFISDRIHSHSIFPTDYMYCPLIQMDNFKGYGVVTHNKTSEMSIKIEKHFAQRPFYHFKNIQDAIDWAKNGLLK